jgi:hypothetical protein
MIIPPWTLFNYRELEAPSSKSMPPFFAAFALWTVFLSALLVDLEISLIKSSFLSSNIVVIMKFFHLSSRIFN